MVRVACFTCLLAICLFALSPPLYADGVHNFNSAGSECDLSTSDMTHTTVNHDHGNGNAWAWGHQKNHGNDDDAEDQDNEDNNGGDQGNGGSGGSGNNGGSGNGGMCGGGSGNNGGGSNNGSGGGTVSMPEPSALLLLMLGLAALLIGNFQNTLRKLSV